MARDGSSMGAAEIAAELRAAIFAGRYDPGDQIPGENPLIKTYGVARMTARRALAMLRDEGLTTTRRGVGVFVRDFQPIVRNSTSRVQSRQWNAGRSSWDSDLNTASLTVDQITVTQAEAPTEEIRGILDLDADEAVTVRNRRYNLDTNPVMVATSYIPARLAQGTHITEADTGPGGIYARLAEAGHAPRHFREDVIGRMPTAEESAVLDLSPGTPVLEIVRTAVTEDGTPVEVNRMVLDSGSFVTRYEFDA